MIEIKQDCYKGTRILLGNKKRKIINSIIDLLKINGFTEIQIPIIQTQEVFKGKVGKENNNLMFNFKDRGDRDLCLAPEYTAVIQNLAKTTFKDKKDVKLFYVAECFRGEKPQSGRYRQFTQLGVEILNPSGKFREKDLCIHLAMICVEKFTKDYIVKQDTTRGLDYYKDGKGFEILCKKLGSSKQVCGGGEYDGGIGFAIGIDRLLLV